jgi:hypothetical protein
MKEKQRIDKFWKDAINENRPTRDTSRRSFQTMGLGGLYQVMSSTRGNCIAVRLAFEAHCLSVDEYGLGKFAIFVSSCMQLRSCDDWEVSICSQLLASSFKFVHIWHLPTGISAFTA